MAKKAFKSLIFKTPTRGSKSKASRRMGARRSVKKR